MSAVIRRGYPRLVPKLQPPLLPPTPQPPTPQPLPSLPQEDSEQQPDLVEEPEAEFVAELEPEAPKAG